MLLLCFLEFMCSTLSDEDPQPLLLPYDEHTALLDDETYCTIRVAVFVTLCVRIQLSYRRETLSYTHFAICGLTGSFMGTCCAPCFVVFNVFVGDRCVRFA